MHRQLSAIIAQYEGAERRVRLLSDRLSDTQWQARREPTRWSPAECVVHLNLTSAACLPLIETGLDAAAELPPTLYDGYRRDPLGWLISVMTGPLQQSGRLRLGAIATAPAFEPSGPLERSAVLAEFSRLQALQLAAVREADELPIDCVSVNSPFDRRLRYSIYSLFCILPRHQLRHVVQAEHIWPT